MSKNKNLVVRCKNPKCGKLYAVGISMDKQTFENPTNQLIDIHSNCPSCRTENVCNKQDFIFPD